MRTYIVLLRGINVGGKNKVSMAELKTNLAEMGYEDVTSYINSGNIILRANDMPPVIGRAIESMLTERFTLDSSVIKVLVLTTAQLRAVIDDRPAGFGDEPGTYHSDVIFLMDITAKEALTVFDPRNGVDAIWPGKGVIYSRRLSAERTKSRLGKIVGTKPYQSMTIRTMNTVRKLAELSRA